MVLVLSLVTYVGTYVAMVEVQRPQMIVAAGPGPWRFDCAPRYRISGSIAKWLFTPIHAVDRMLFPDRWTYVFDWGGAVPYTPLEPGEE